MTTLHLRNVRCFSDSGPAHIAPLTILVGENSAGKSSFLALQRIALEVAHGHLNPNFNREPFFLGAYDQIAHYRGGRYGRARSFEIRIGVEAVSTPKIDARINHKKEIIATFEKKGSQPALSSILFECGDYSFENKIDENNDTALIIKTPKWSRSISKGTFKSSFLGMRGGLFDPRYLAYIFRDGPPSLRRLSSDFPEPGSEEAKIVADEIGLLSEAWQKFVEAIDYEPYAIAPVRTKPERTYNPIDDTPRSEGSHVHMFLAKALFTDRKRWEIIKVSLDNFGKASGLFEEIKVKTLGRSDSDPFQIMIKISGPWSNLIDVGYGVSQIMPIIVDLVGNRNKNLYLLQQPEVHLHPKGQAALGTFLCNLVKNGRSHVIAETHSDYLVDRVRMEVRWKNLDPDKVSILFFERNNLAVKIHQLRLDGDGNLCDAPPSYRNFFIAEEDRLLGL